MYKSEKMRKHSQFEIESDFSSRKFICSFVFPLLILVITSVIYTIFFDSLTPVTKGIIGILLSAILLLTMPMFDWAPIYVIRFLLLAVPGLAFSSLVLFNETTVEFAAHGIQFQIPEIASNVVLITTAALSASAIGWYAALRCPSLMSLPSIGTNLNSRFVTYGLIALVSGTFAGASLPDFVWIAPYSRGMAPYLNIGIFSVFAVFGLIGMWVVLLLNSKLGFWYFVAFSFIASYVLLFCLLFRGARLDVMGAMMGFVFVYVMAKSKKLNIFLLIIVFGALALFSQVWSGYRAYAHCATVQEIVGAAFFSSNSNLASCSSIKTDKAELEQSESSVIKYRPNTMGDVVSTLYQVVGMVDAETIRYEYGETYLNFLKSTLPRFIYPDRPEAYKFPSATNQTTGGSLYELAEAYANFGFLGCILIPAFLAFLFGRIHRGALQHKTFFPLLAYGIVLTLLIRGTWYQNFSFYKATFSWLLVELTICLVGAVYFQWLQRKA